MRLKKVIAIAHNGIAIIMPLQKQDFPFPDYIKQYLELIENAPHKLYFPSEGEYPELNTHEHYLISGSPHSVNDNIPWIRSLEWKLEHTFHYDKTFKSMVGICFGHQLIAKALYGHVEGCKKNLKVGTYTLNTENPLFEKLPGAELTDTIHNFAWHSNRVSRKPKQATVVASNDRDPYAILYYSDKNILTFQMHPEIFQHRLDDIYTPSNNQFCQFNTKISASAGYYLTDEKQVDDSIQSFKEKPRSDELLTSWIKQTLEL